MEFTDLKVGKLFAGLGEEAKPPVRCLAMNN